MMKLAAGFGLAIGCVVGGNCLAEELPAPFDTELGRKYRVELTLVQVPASLLPPGCVLARTTGSAPIFPATTNPHATEDRQLIGFVAALIGGRRFDPATVLAAITALYHDGARGHEIGVWGLRFKTERAASEAYGTIVSTRPPKRGLVLVRKGPMVVLVWRDEGVRDAAFDAISTYIENTEFRLVD